MEEINIKPLASIKTRVQWLERIVRRLVSDAASVRKSASSMLSPSRTTSLILTLQSVRLVEHA